VINTAEKWEQNADASEFTFYMRKGMKWSDGQDLDTDDVKFWYEDVYLNPDITPSHGNIIDNVDKTPCQVTIVDKYTFKVKFKNPKPLLAIMIAKNGAVPTLQAGPSFAMPEHYLKKWHIKYGDQAAIDAKLKELKLTKWTELWNTGGSSGDLQGPIAFWFLNPERPTITGWVLKVAPPADPLVEERNPYFFKVDTQGNQLPYIDGIQHALFTDQQVFNMWLISGKIDCQYRHSDAGAFTLYKENEAKGGYKVQKNIAASVSCFFPNINNPDQALAKLFDTPDFRHALSIAINRKEINDLIYNGVMNPMQACPVHGSPNFDEAFTKVWTEYDPKTANALLDGLGLKMGADGKTRDRPDGKPLQITIETQDTTGSTGLDECNQVAKYWSAIGIATSVKQVERSLYEQHCHDGALECGRWGCDRQSVVMADPRRYTAEIDDGPWAPLYGHWYSKSTYKQLEPPADHPIRKIWDLWDKTQVEPDETKRNAIFKSLLDIHKANPWMIGTVGESPALWIVKNNFHNVPQGYIEDDTLRDYGVAEPWQFYMDKA
jgi:peptide/nickel transport system substrate-binding protein